MADTDQEIIEGGLRTDSYREELASEESNLAEDIELQEEEEIEYANQLAREQEEDQIEQEANLIFEEGQSFKNPSFFKYWVILIPWAILVDIIDAVDLTGAGVPIGRAFSVFSWISIMLILWFTDHDLKRAHNFAEDLEERISHIQKNIARSTKLALKAGKYARKIPGMKGVARAIPRGLVRVRRLARKNPITKVLIGGAINIIPGVAVLNLLCVWVYLSYRDEKKSFNQARVMSEEARNEILETESEVV